MARGGSSAAADSAEKSIPALSNIGYFSDYYLAHRLDAGLADLYGRWDAAEKVGDPTTRTRVRGLSSALNRYRADAANTAPDEMARDTGRLDLGDLPRDAREALLALNDETLDALGWKPGRGEVVELVSGDKAVSVRAAHRCETPTGLLLLAVDTVFTTDPPEVVASKTAPTGRLVEPVLVNGKPAAYTALDAAQLIFTVDDPPSYLLFVSGGAVTLLDRDRWGEGISLGANLDDALARHDVKPKGELAALAALFSADAINPGDEAQSVLFSLLDRAATESAGVSKELRHGMRRSVEILANAVVHDVRYRQKGAWMKIDPRDLTRQSLRYLYRIIVLLFAEARPELGILPSDDPEYQSGYSMARLRDIALVELHSDHARNSRHLQHSVDILCRLVNHGHAAEQTLDADDTRELTFPGLRSALFGRDSCPLIDGAHLTDEVLQQVIANLCFTREKAGQRRQAVSYSTLGINQLGAVYEGLMAYTGLLATQAFFEVDKDGDPDNGSWVIPVDRADEFPEDVFLTEHGLDGSTKRVRYEEGDFVFRLSGRDRQRSASYYTPEVLTEFTVRHALDALFKENPELTALDILKLTVCEPALGSGAFLNEAISQLAERYLKAAQDESGEVIDPELYQLELQHAKAHFAVNQVYGVDLNRTAVELAEVSLWLNCMHDGLQAPWFGARLRAGNSLIGARRSTYTPVQVKAAAWAGKNAAAPTDKPIAEVPLGTPVGIHHFLVPGQGWGAPSGAKEVKELAPEWATAVDTWRKSITRRPNQRQLERFDRLAQQVEKLWANAAREVEAFWQATRQHIDVWGAETPAAGTRFGEAAIREVLGNPQSATFRLRTLMDTWCSLWLWAPENGTELPSLDQWLSAAEALTRIDDPWHPETLFADERELPLASSSSLDDILEAHPWLGQARAIAATQNWFHWELEFSPVFEQGGFDVQVANPPWRRPSWDEPASLAEHDAWWGVTDLTKAPVAARRARREEIVSRSEFASAILRDRAEVAGTASLLDAQTREPLLRGVQTNLYMVFITNTWRRMRQTGVAGLLHPESHFVDPKAGALRSETYKRLRSHWQFANGFFLFPEVGHRFEFGVNTYASPRKTRFLQAVYLLTPVTLDASLTHDGTGEPPGVQFADGGWDTRPHAARIVTVDDDALGDWVKLFDLPGTPPGESRLLRPLTTSDLGALAVFARQPHRLTDSVRYWTRGFDEDKLKNEGTGEWRTEVPESLEDCILQGPHILNCTPYAQQPRPNCRSKGDWDPLDLDSLPGDFVPRTNYQRAVSPDEFLRRQTRWNGFPYAARYREAHREFVDVALMRTLQSCILPRGPVVLGSIVNIGLKSDFDVARLSGLYASLPYDYLVKVSGVGHIKQYLTDRIPLPRRSRLLDAALVLRTLRLNALTERFAALWSQLYDDAWRNDCFIADDSTVSLGEVHSHWTDQTPLRREYDRWLALCEIDAIAALLLGLTAHQLIQMYRSQFAVLRKYEYATLFDANGRRVSAHHQNYGFLQGRLEADAKRSGVRGWTRAWDRVQGYQLGDVGEDLGPFVPPFRQADREHAMSMAYWTLAERYELIPPESAERPP